MTIPLRPRTNRIIHSADFKPEIAFTPKLTRKGCYKQFMSDWYGARVASRRPNGDGLTHLELDVAGTPLAGSHLRAGQYVKLSVDGKQEAFFALASRPHERGTRFELLVKTGAPVADAAAALGPGASVMLSLPQGDGFPLEQARGKDVVFIATGSGLSPIRSALEVIRADRKSYGAVALYLGARTPGHIPYADELSTWEREGIRVNRVVSQPGSSGWRGLTGYVQAHLGDVGKDAVAFIAGQKAMVAAVKALLAERGIPPERIFLNFG
jgi:sulfhydrogenase subunit gamma (sulfur reductase)